MLDPNAVAQAIKDYIENQWYYRIGWDIEVTSDGDNNYTAILRYTQMGYNTADYTFECIITFDDVQDANEEMAEETDIDRYNYFSALVEVETATVPQVNLIDTEDFYSFKETVDEFYTFLRRVYSMLPARSDERFYFFGYND